MGEYSYFHPYADSAKPTQWLLAQWSLWENSLHLVGCVKVTLQHVEIYIWSKQKVKLNVWVEPRDSQHFFATKASVLKREHIFGTIEIMIVN